MKSAEIRQKFLNYFHSEQHQIVASSSLVPHNDPTLLFTNAGMVQFKDVFLGSDKRDYTRAVSCQRCVRAGGKHNDLENVGYTARHHTFFEMLGNFSFGDYFKQDAIRFGWTFLTEILALPKERLWVTVHHTDKEAEDIWLNEIGVDPNRFSRLDEDNFWQMGDTGPCGPCTEIFYDHGPDVAGGPPGSVDDDLDRYIEIWNLVFMQYDRQPDGELIPLPKPSVDTGMGLERIAAVMQGVHSNYEIDIFQALIQAAQRETNAKDNQDKSLRVIADHIRSCSFLISDGVVPSNEGRGYVLRRIIRRAIRHGHQLGQTEFFFYKLVADLVKEMGGAYPDLAANQKKVEQMLLKEEEQFAKTLDQGIKVLESALANLQTAEIPGEVVFRLYDTYGFPMDLTADIARERNLTIDEAGFEASMEAQRQRARNAGNFAGNYHDVIQTDAQTCFLGYEQLQSTATAVELYKEGERVKQLIAGDVGIIILNKTPCYAEGGGQVGDQGLLTLVNTNVRIKDTTKQHLAYLHHVVIESGQVSVNDEVDVIVDEQRRRKIMANHSATHLMHAALRKILGEHVQQKGSLVNADYLRFDFAHDQAVTAEQILHVERIVNNQIRQNVIVQTELMDIDTAKAKGAMALFGEKYEEQVRVLTMGDNNFSIELCGGTHVKQLGDIGLFQIMSESGIAAGVRRIEAVTGAAAIDLVQTHQKQLLNASALLKTSPRQLVEKTEQVVIKQKQLEKEVERLKMKLASGAKEDLMTYVQDVEGIKLLVARMDELDAKSLRQVVDQYKQKLGQGIIVLASGANDKVALAVGVSDNLINQIKAGQYIAELATLVGGKGGGRADFAQAGGQNIEQLDNMMNQAATVLVKLLAK